MEGAIAVPLIIALPLLGFAILGLWGKRIGEPASGWLASLLVLGSFLIGVGLTNEGGSRWEIENWLPGIGFSLVVDNLSGLMVMIVAGVGFLIHVYAIGYMHGDEGYSRFFGYFNLFIAMMLTLVLADNFVVMFIGWEGVGLASYLLIGFWYKERINADSARKAFIVNRIGDLGFLLGMAVLWLHFGTLSISELREQLEGPNPAIYVLGLATALLFIGAIGKSAQVPLMVWLPDAMAGPTPVSALIHAATMVTAGVYLIARASFMFELAPEVSFAVALIGLITAIYGALCAFGQTDIKRIVAYSTLSQLGFMFVAAGVGAYWVAMFHVLTHAFFKALLFMASGSVIHALGGEQDIRKMGGMRKYLPLTHIHGLIGTLALGGFPLLSGFWSKDAILASAYEYNIVFYIGLLLTAGLTALYAMRWYVSVFLGEYRGKEHPHESPAVMTFPNHILTAGAVAIGFIGLPFVIMKENPLQKFLAPALPHHEGEVHHLPVLTEWILILLSAAVAVVALWYGYRYWQKTKYPAWLVRFQKASLNSFYADYAYNTVIVNPLKNLAGLFLSGDKGLLMGFWGLGPITQLIGGLLARLETGLLRFYVAALLLAVVLVLALGVLR